MSSNLKFSPFSFLQNEMRKKKSLMKKPEEETHL